MALDNDTRGWIMACISGVACVLGASVICVDIILRVIPGWHDFSISESDQFLSASLSLSFGVMLFSALYSMLPQSKTYLKDAGYSPRTASFMLIGFFLAGVIGIRVLSRFIHQFIPSHVVDCDHTHGQEEDFPKDPEEVEDHSPSFEHRADFPASKCHPRAADDEHTPLLSRTATSSPKKRSHETPENADDAPGRQFFTAPNSRRPSFMPRTLTRTFSKYVTGWKENCDEMGPCMGFSDPCGQDCFKVVVHRRGSILPGHGPFSRAPTWRTPVNDVRVALLSEEEERSISNGSPVPLSDSPAQKLQLGRSRSSTHLFHHLDNGHQERGLRRPSHHSHRSHHSHHSNSAAGQEHHHHVPTNAFLSIGLQTSAAIALHKAPEGFITYATNHANPQLGFAVFMALFIHNITEGYAMSLPLYLALGSRFKAIVWSSFLGGASQPLGAGIAALWFKVANRTSMGAPTEGVYGGMFAITAGVMTSVALSLFSESLSLSHNKGTCVAFAFLGMGILGCSFALTAS